MIYLTSDHHFMHSKIIEYCNRPFKNYQEMDRVLIENYNSVVSKDDTVFILGDFTMSNNREVIEKYCSQLNGNKHLILGNHDRAKAFTYIDCGFLSVHTSFPLDEYNLLMVHDPSDSDAAKSMGYDKILCGHVHGLFKFKNNVLNIGIDQFDYTPISLETALSHFCHFIPEVKENRDVHTEHCCVFHGCKYNDNDCPVENRIKRQSYPCEQCEEHLKKCK